MHNLGTVYSFEVVRTLKKKSFWITLMVFPIMMVALGSVMYFSNKTTEEKSLQMSKEKFSTIMTDESHIVNQDLAKGMGIQQVSDKQSGIEQVKSGKVDAYIYYPADLAKNQVEIYAKEAGVFQNDKYSSVAKLLITQSATQAVTGNYQAVLTNHFNVMTQTYQNGAEYDGIKKMIAPGLFLVMFYFVIVMFGSQAMVSTTEEKENRVIEMILTTVESRTLVVGKILSIVTLALLQVSIFVALGLAAYSNFYSILGLPAIDWTLLFVDPPRIVLAAVLFFVSFLMFTGLLVTVGAAAPTAKEANSFFGFLMMLLFGPLYAASLFISAPESILVKVLTFFPLTSPVPMLLRNAVGNLEPWEVALGLAILLAFTVITLGVAVRTFRYGAVEYSKKLSLGMILGKSPKTAK